MQYDNMVPGIFLARPNRFIAHVQIDGKVETVHVKNTGRCKELLPVGAKVWCQKSSNPQRKTQVDLVSVHKGARIINMDSQAPNEAVWEWLSSGGLGEVSDLRREVMFEDSRFDFAFRKDGVQCYLEVKGVTLETEGVCAFPDAPTQRGTRHIRELMKAVAAGCGAYVLFVIQMADAEYLHPNDATDPAFGAALREVSQAGVQVLAMDCEVTPTTMSLNKEVPVRLFLSK